MKTWTRWIPAIVVPAVVVAAGAIIAPLSANADVNLPDKTPTQVLALIGSTKVTAFSATVQTTSNLGLPSLPSTGRSSTDSAEASALALLSGSHTARVYRDGATKERVQVIDQLAESDVVVNGSNVWLYSSKDNSVIHSTLPSGTRQAPATTGKTPDDLAISIVSALEPSSTLTVDKAQRVAGRTAYTLVLTPKATDTLVGSISIAVDSATGLPLKVDVTAAGETDAAFELAFTDLKLSTPSSALFTFSPPKGATVKQVTVPTRPAGTPGKVDGTAPLGTGHSGTGHSGTGHAGSKPTVTGSGWDAVVSIAADTSSLTSSPQFRQLSTAVSGGRLIHTALLNVLVTDDGKVFAGSVSAAKLEAAASGT